MPLNDLIGVVVIALAALLLLLPRARGRGRRAVLRPVPPTQRFLDAASRALERGEGLHVSLGDASMAAPWSASAWVGLEAYRQSAPVAVLGDTPGALTSGDGGFALLAQEAIRRAALAQPLQHLHPSELGYLAGPSPSLYVAGALLELDERPYGAQLLLGHFSPLATLLVSDAGTQGIGQLVASDALPAQAAFALMTPDALAGEELFAVPAAVGERGSAAHGLLVEDVLRALLILSLVLGCLFELFKP
jgi:hypothetical protein